jgi:hypothetical protein
MIAFSRRSAPNLPITRQFEFTRLQNQFLAHAYQALIPVVSRRLEQAGSRHSDDEPATGTIQGLRSKAGGA